jgi:hypothetical protein
MKKLFTMAICSILLLSACNRQQNTQPDNAIFDVNIDAEKEKGQIEEAAKADVIFYNLFSPIDLDKILDNKNAFFNSNNLNSLDNLTKYTDSYKMALNVGIYGADLSYLWVFEQSQQALSYLSAIQHLTNKLGIPRDFVDFTMMSAEHNANELDTLKSIAREAYEATDTYLKGSERENTAILILLGGWIETLHISLNMYTEPDKALASKILTQKYSLNSLITMVQNHQDELKMSEYLLLLKKLNATFSAFESKLKPTDIIIDTLHKQISIKKEAELTIQPQEFALLKEQVENIRNHIIE